MTDESPTTPSRSSTPAEPPETSGKGAWLARLAGLGMLSEQSVSHALGKGSDLILVGAGLILLAGKEGVTFLRIIFGRDEGR